MGTDALDKDFNISPTFLHTKLLLLYTLEPLI